MFRKKKEFSLERPYNTNYSGPKWGYRLLMILLVYGPINIVSQLTLESKYPALLISSLTSLFLILFIILVMSRLTKNMFKARHRQYGFFLLIFLCFSLYGMTRYKDVEAYWNNYYESSGHELKMQLEVERYFEENPTIDSIEYTVADSIAYSIVRNSPELYGRAMMAWEYHLLWYSSSWPFFVFFVFYIIYGIKFRIDIYRLRRQIHKD